MVEMVGNGSSATSATTSSSRFISNNMTGTDGATVIQIMDYTATDKHKSVLVRANSGSATAAHAGRWANTSAINEINFNSSLPAGATIHIYGIEA